MITRDNLKALLTALNFQENNNIFSKNFKNSETYLKVDFTKNLLVYPTDKGLIVSGDYTTNLESQKILLFLSVSIAYLKKATSQSILSLSQNGQLGMEQVAEELIF